MSDKVKVRGWLILFFVSVISVIYISIISILDLGNLPLETPGLLYGTEFISNLIIMIFALVVFILGYYKRKKYTPKLVICYLWTVTLISFIPPIIFVSESEIAFSTFLSGTWIKFARSVIISVLWTIYFLKSKRVRETFVN